MQKEGIPPLNRRICNQNVLERYIMHRYLGMRECHVLLYVSFTSISLVYAVSIHFFMALFDSQYLNNQVDNTVLMPKENTHGGIAFTNR